MILQYMALQKAVQYEITPLNVQIYSHNGYRPVSCTKEYSTA